LLTAPREDFVKRAWVLVALLAGLGCGSDDSSSKSTGVGGTGGSSTGGNASGGTSSGGNGGSGNTSAGGASGSGNASSGGTAGSGGAPPGNDNPDNLPESSTPIYSNDYDTNDPTGVTSVEDLAVGTWGANLGYQSGGWSFQPDPIADPSEDMNEDAAGWAYGVQGSQYFPLDTYDLVTVSYMYKVSQALLEEIALGGPFWAHDQKAIDFKYHDPTDPNGEGNRNTIHFGENEGQIRFSHVDGGGGTKIYFGPDWLGLADQWVWLCHVIDMRGATAEQRYVATYVKVPGDAAVTRIGIRYETSDPPLQTYDGRGIWGFLSPIHGYWDDMVDANGLTNDLADMSLAVDRLRIMPGWPDAANGPPF
jgi:hypothetical protein